MDEDLVVCKSLIPGTKEWLQSKVKFASSCAAFAKGNCIPLSNACVELINHKAWELYFDDEPKTWERLCREAIHGTEPRFLDRIIEGVRILQNGGHEGPIPSSMAERVANTPVVGKHGGDRRSDGIRNQGANRHLKRSSSESQERIISRLKRDHPNIANDLAEGKYRSARAAGKVAGFIRDETPFEKVMKLLPKLTEEERKEVNRITTIGT